MTADANTPPQEKSWVRTKYDQLCAKGRQYAYGPWKYILYALVLLPGLLIGIVWDWKAAAWYFLAVLAVLTCIYLWRTDDKKILKFVAATVVLGGIAYLILFHWAWPKQDSIQVRDTPPSYRYQPTPIRQQAPAVQWQSPAASVAQVVTAPTPPPEKCAPPSPRRPFDVYKTEEEIRKQYLASRVRCTSASP